MVPITADPSRTRATHNACCVQCEHCEQCEQCVCVVCVVDRCCSGRLSVQHRGRTLPSFDAAIVAISIASLVPFLPDKLATLRLLRVLRPLRLLSRIPGMKTIFLFAVTATGSIAQVLLVVAFCQLIYSLLGMELFMGMFASCTDPTLTTRDACEAATANAHAAIQASGSRS